MALSLLKFCVDFVNALLRYVEHTWLKLLPAGARGVSWELFQNPLVLGAALVGGVLFLVALQHWLARFSLTIAHAALLIPVLLLMSMITVPAADLMIHQPWVGCVDAAIVTAFGLLVCRGYSPRYLITFSAGGLVVVLICNLAGFAMGNVVHHPEAGAIIVAVVVVFGPFVSWRSQQSAPAANNPYGTGVEDHPSLEILRKLGKLKAKK